MSKLSAYRFRRRLIWIGVILLILLALTVCTAAFLFQVNRFSLELTPVGQREMVLQYGEPYGERGASVKLYGSLVLRDGVDLDIPVTVDGSINEDRIGTYTVE